MHLQKLIVLLQFVHAVVVMVSQVVYHYCQLQLTVLQVTNRLLCVR